MSLRKKQSTFSHFAALLTLKAEEMGYEVTEGDAYRDPRLHGLVGEKKGYGHARSLHKVRLAVDRNLFKDGVYIRDDTGHRELHEWWVEQGGNPMIEGDFNHYSWPHEMMR